MLGPGYGSHRGWRCARTCTMTETATNGQDPAVRGPGDQAVPPKRPQRAGTGRRDRDRPRWVMATLYRVARPRTLAWSFRGTRRPRWTRCDGWRGGSTVSSTRWRGRDAGDWAVMPNISRGAADERAGLSRRPGPGKRAFRSASGRR